PNAPPVAAILPPAVSIPRSTPARSEGGSGAGLVPGEDSLVPRQVDGVPPRYASHPTGASQLSPVGPVVMALGGVSLGGAGVAWLVGDSQYNTLRRQCLGSSSTCPRNASSTADSIRTLDTV